MPYIAENKRPQIDKVIDQFSRYFSSLPETEVDGALNYAITKLFKQVYPKSYWSYNRAVGVLTCILLEYYRRVVSPYEDQKIAENGDV